MPLPALLTASLLTFLLCACSDHSAGLMVTDNSPPPPAGDPDPTIVGSGSGGSSNNSNNGGGNGGGATTNNKAPTGTGNPPQGEPVPEPGTMLLVGTGLAGVALLRRRRKVQAS